MLDPRNDPHGYDPGEIPQRYRIRERISPVTYGTRYELRGGKTPPYELGEVVERKTFPATDPITHRIHHALDERDQLYADLCAELVQEACEWFYTPTWQPLEGVDHIRLTDDQIRDSIRTLDLGENSREAVRMAKPRYVLTELPWVRQRALIERLYALRERFAFEKLGPVEPAQPSAVFED